MDDHVDTKPLKHSKRRVHVLASVGAPNRDWAATLPHGSAKGASWDRCFKYAWLRRPTGAGAGSTHLQPLQVIHVQSHSERIELESQMPSFINAVFVERQGAPMRSSELAD